MYTSDILALVQYNFWANAQILRVAEKISPKQFLAPMMPDPGWGNIRGTLVHTLDTEYGWRNLVQFGKPTPEIPEADFPDVASVAARWDEERVEWLAYIASLDDASLNGFYTYLGSDGATRKRRVWQTIVHVVNHGTQHRSEVAAFLTGYGSSPGELDFGLFLRDHPQFIDGQAE